MISKLFLGISLLGAEWVLYLLMFISILSIGLILDRLLFYKKAAKDAARVRQQIRTAAEKNDWGQIKEVASKPSTGFESDLARALMGSSNVKSMDALEQIGQDSLIRTRLSWEKHLAILATIGSNAPFVGLFGTVLGIIQAFHDLSKQQAGAGMGAQAVTAGISEALIATAIGILVAIPAVVAFNLFQRKVKSSLAEAEALKSYLIGRMSSEGK